MTNKIESIRNRIDLDDHKIWREIQGDFLFNHIHKFIDDQKDVKKYREETEK